MLPFLFVLIAALGWSFFPLVIGLAGGDSSPFLFNAFLRLGNLGGGTLFLLYRGSGRLRDRASWSALRRPPVFYGILGKGEFIVFGFAAAYAGLPLTALTYELWPVFMAVFMLVLFRGEGRHEVRLMRLSVGLLLGFAGLCLTASGSVGGFGGIDAALLLGVTLALLSAFMGGSHNALLLRWSASAGSGSSSWSRSERQERELFFAVLGQTVCCGLIMPFSFVGGWVLGEPVSWTLALYGTALGWSATLLADTLWRAGNLRTSNPGVNSACYLTPLLALCWLSLFLNPGSPAGSLWLILGGGALTSAGVGLCAVSARFRRGDAEV